MPADVAAGVDKTWLRAWLRRRFSLSGEDKVQIAMSMLKLLMLYLCIISLCSIWKQVMSNHDD